MTGGGPPHEPEILAFACSRCGIWASRTLGGEREERPKYRLEVYPVDCAGSVPTTLVTEPLEKGIDGVILLSCGDGLCHYFNGEARLATRVEMMRSLAEDLGIEPERIHMQKVPDRSPHLFDEALEGFVAALASLGPSPYKTGDGAPRLGMWVNIWPSPPQGCGAPIDNIREEARRTGVVQCLECGKCTASCPVTPHKADFSPMYLIEKALRAPGPEVGTTADYWTCLTCANCSERCPSNVDFVDFVRYLREKGGVDGDICTHGGVLQGVWKHQAKGAEEEGREIRQRRTGWVTDDIKVADKGKVLYFVGCLPYLDAIFDGIGFKGGGDIAANVVRILNAADIVPAVMRDEVCCGHDAYYSGNRQLFEDLAKRNIEVINASGASKVIFSCPEGLHMFRKHYPALGLAHDIEAVHISEVIAGLLHDGSLVLGDGSGEGEGKKVTYHDPCRLVRFEKVIAQPRHVLEALPAVELVEPPRSRELSTCCGTSAWMNCSGISERVRTERLAELRATGADEVITACPKCQVHFRCTLSAKPEERGLDRDTRVTDIVTFVARHLKGGGDG